MACNIAGASSIAQECDGTRNRELTEHVRNVLRRLEQEQLQQRLLIRRDNKKCILSNSFTNDLLQDINTLDVSTDWCWLSILEFRKEGLYGSRRLSSVMFSKGTLGPSLTSRQERLQLLALALQNVINK